MINALGLVWNVVELVIGLAVMVLGARILIEAAKWLVKVSGISDLFVGAALLSLVTIVLELFIGLAAITHQQGSLVVTAVAGVVLVSLGLLMGLNLILAPREIERKKFGAQVGSLMVAIAVLMWLSGDGELGRVDSLVLLGMAVAVIVINWIAAAKGLWQKKGEEPKEKAKLLDWQLNRFKEKGRASIALNIGRVLVGGVLVLVAAGYLLRNSELLAANFGWSNQLLALTIVAWAIALPALVTVITALWSRRTGHEAGVERRGQMNISAGNLMGISLMSVTLAVGICAFLRSGNGLSELQNWMATVGEGEMVWNNWRIFGIGRLSAGSMLVMPEATKVYLPLALVFCVLLGVPALIKGKLYRWQGIVLVLGYLGLMWWRFCIFSP